MTRSGRPSKRPDDGPSSRSARATGTGLQKSKSSYDWREKVQQFQDWLSERRKLAIVEPEHIEPGRRLIALGIDFGAAFFISMAVVMLPLVNTVLTANLVMLLLMCSRDYFFGGRGLGKNIMGLKVVDIFTGQPPGIKTAVIRNLVFLGPLLLLEALHLLLKIIPGAMVTFVLTPFYWVATLYVLVILPIECYRTWRREDSMRLGDEIAGTCLLESETDFSGFLPK